MVKVLLIDSIYDRIRSGILHDNDLKPYSKEFMVKLLNFYESKEEYEKCQTLKEIIDKRFIHENAFEKI